MNTETMRQEMQDVLVKNILPFWQTRMIDRENGGFYGRIDGQEVLHADAEKGAILNARILWTFSAAYRVLKDESYLETATYAKDYFITASSSMPSALPSTACRNMPGLRVIMRPLTMRWRSSIVSRSTPSTMSTMVISKPPVVTGSR